MAENKTKPTTLSVDAFIDAVEHPVRQADARILRDLMARLTGEKPVIWGSSIIGYGTYHYKYESGREGDFLIVGFSPRKTSLSLYVLSDFPGQDTLLAKLGKHKVGRGCLYINKLGDVDMGVLEDLIAASFAHMRKKYP